MVITGNQRPTPRGDGGGSAHPVKDGHPLITPHRNAQLAHIGDQFTGIGDFFIAPFQTELGFVQGWAAF